MLDSLGADYTLAPPLTTPPDGSIAIVTGFERELLSRLASRSAGTSLVVITPPDAQLPANELSDLRVDAVVPAASIAEVASALRRLPAPAAPPATAAGGQDLPWWIRPAQDTPSATSPPSAQPPRDTAVLATAPLPAFGQPIDPHGVPSTETLAMGTDEPSRRRFVLTGRQARIASIVAVVIAVAVTSLIVFIPRSSPSANAAATSGLGGGTTTPFGNSNGSNGFNGSGGQGSQGSGTSPQFGAPGSTNGQGGTGTRRGELQQFLACMKQNGVTIDRSNLRSLDPSDPKLRTALEKCASLMPFGRFRGGFGGSSGGGLGSGTSGSATNGSGTSGSHPT